MDSVILFYDPLFIHYSQVLSNFLKLESAQLKFEKNLFGKPYLIDQRVFFNVSHKTNMGVIAINKNREVGVDIEESTKVIRGAAKFLHPDENKILSSLSSDEKNKFTMQLFCIKESIVKAKGIGLSIPLESLSLSTFIGQSQFTYVSKLFDECYELNFWQYQEYYISVAVLV